MQFGHIIKVHPIDCANKRWRHHRNRYHREKLNSFILLNIDLVCKDRLNIIKRVHIRSGKFYKRV